MSFSFPWARITGLSAFVVGLAATLPTAADAQDPTPAKPVSTCAPEIFNHSGHYVPMFGPGDVPDSLVPELKALYELSPQATDARPRLEAFITAAANSPCALALAHFELGSRDSSNRFDEAGAQYQEALRLFTQINSPLGIARTHYSLGIIASFRVQNELASSEFQAASQSFTLAGDPEEALITRVNAAGYTKHADWQPLLDEAHQQKYPCVEGRIQDFWGADANRAGHLDEAMQHDLEADRLYSQCANHEYQRAGVQTNMGRLERQQGRPLAALEHYKIALDLQIASGDVALVPQTYNAMAVAYDSMKDFEHSIPLYQKALDVAHQIHSQPFIDFLEANLGATYARSGHADLAIPLLEVAVAKVPKDNDSLRCVRYRQLGTAYQRTGRAADAVTALNTSITSCTARSDHEELIDAYEYRANAEADLHHNEDALRDYQQALTFLDETRSHLVPADAYKQGYVEQQIALFDETIAVLTTMQRPADALEIAERARARAFLDLLESHSLNTTIAAKTAANPAEEARNAELLSSPAHAEALNTAQIAASAARLHSTFVSYWLTPTTLYLWVIQPANDSATPAIFEATQTISAAQLEQLITATHTKSSATAWRSLYTTLIAPIESHLPHDPGALPPILPSGPLFAVPFSALRAPDGHYLLERYRLHTVPSAGILLYTLRNQVSAQLAADKFLLVADPAHPPTGADGHPLPRLPGTEAELASIAHILPAASTTRLEGPRATPDNLFADAPSATVLHFATHAVLNESQPYESYLALDDTTHHGKLTVAEIYALHLNARLVVLSACSTGLGKISGDGVAGMSRAFFYAGSASVLTTLWDIADRPTSRLMPRFYAALEHGATPSEALRQAQLAILQDLRAGRLTTETLAGTTKLPPDPLYWAGFSLVGEP